MAAECDVSKLFTIFHRHLKWMSDVLHPLNAIHPLNTLISHRNNIEGLYKILIQ